MPRTQGRRRRIHRRPVSTINRRAASALFSWSIDSGVNGRDPLRGRGLGEDAVVCELLVSTQLAMEDCANVEGHRAVQQSPLRASRRHSGKLVRDARRGGRLLSGESLGSC